MYSVRIERDSITRFGERLTSFICCFPRFVLAEVNTHRMFTRSSASSRAIPVQQQLDRLENDPFFPVYWGKNQRGMQAEQELTDEEILEARKWWAKHKDDSVAAAKSMMEIGVHKQIANRVLEAHMWHTAIITSTEWPNFWHLRDNAMAQPEFKMVAAEMHVQYKAASPTLVREGDWHHPFIKPEETDPNNEVFLDTADSVRTLVSIGRSARVSYLTHEGTRDVQADIALAKERLRPSGHMAPFEHAAFAMTHVERALFGKRQMLPAPNSTFARPEWVEGTKRHFCGNFDGWVQARKTIPNEWDALAPGAMQ